MLFVRYLYIFAETLSVQAATALHMPLQSSVKDAVCPSDCVLACGSKFAAANCLRLALQLSSARYDGIFGTWAWAENSMTA